MATRKTAETSKIDAAFVASFFKDFEPRVFSDSFDLPPVNPGILFFILYLFNFIRLKSPVLKPNRLKYAKRFASDASTALARLKFFIRSLSDAVQPQVVARKTTFRGNFLQKNRSDEFKIDYKTVFAGINLALSGFLPKIKNRCNKVNFSRGSLGIST